MSEKPEVKDEEEDDYPAAYLCSLILVVDYSFIANGFVPAEFCNTRLNL